MQIQEPSKVAVAVLPLQASGTGTAASPLLLEGEERADAAVDDPSASEEKELQEKVNSEVCTRRLCT